VTESLVISGVSIANRGGEFIGNLKLDNFAFCLIGFEVVFSYVL